MIRKENFKNKILNYLNLEAYIKEKFDINKVFYRKEKVVFEIEKIFEKEN